jgi:hypothetical protein
MYHKPQLHLFEGAPPVRQWPELPAEVRTAVLCLLTRAASRMLRKQKEIDHDQCDRNDEDQDSAR